MRLKALMVLLAALMLIVGTLPAYAQDENPTVEVINNEVPAKMLRFQDADHGFLRGTPPDLSKAYELYSAQEQIIWFRTYLGN
jgi:hypothetical protein